MSYEITSESYGRRLPKITATADSADDLATLGTDWAEGSTCVIGSTTYSLDKVQGWVEPGSGGGGGGGGSSAIIEEFTWDPGSSGVDPGYISTRDASELFSAYTTGHTLLFHFPAAPLYSIPDFYATLVTLAMPEEGSSDLVVGILKEGLIGWQSNFSLSITKIRNGKLFIGPYID